MNFKEQLYSVLIISASEKFNASLIDMLPNYKYEPITQVQNISAARRILAEREYDFIIINSPLSDDDGVRFSIDISSGKSSIVMMFIRAEMYSSVFDKVSKSGVYTLPKPTAKPIILQGLDWMASTRERLRRLEKKTLSLEEKMQEIRLVNRAKWLLITELNIPEDEAHRCIEKQAMNKCVSKREIAEEIIKTYT